MNNGSIRNTILLALAGLFTFQCQHSNTVEVENSGSQIVEINSHDLSDYVSEADFISSVEYIPLNQPEAGIIGNVTDLKMKHNKFYLLDHSNQSIHEFDKMGNHIKTLKKSGDGPEEYNEILNFSIGENELIVNDMWEVLHYSLDDFSFKKSFSKEFMGFKTYVTQNGHVINHQLNSPPEGDPFNITVYDYRFNKITDQKEKVQAKMFGLTFSQKNHFYTNLDDEYFTLPLNDTVYKLSEGKLQFHKLISFQDIQFEIKNLPDDRPITSNDIINQKKAFFVGNYLESTSHLTFSFTYNQRRYKYLMDKGQSMAHIFPSIKQLKTPLLLPIDYYVLEESSVYTFKDIEEAKYEISQVEKRIAGNQQLEELTTDLKTRIENSSLLILKINLK